MNESSLIPDADARRMAETVDDRNIVVIAGAGTGKTTLLVGRLIALLMRRSDPLLITDIVALTFTNKAAAEMKLRLQERLRVLVEAPRMSEDGSVSVDGADEAEAIARQQGVSPGDVARRARAALNDMEKAQIGTLHSFAAHLLRLYPIQAGVLPAFREDDGSHFDERFDEEWRTWLDTELSEDGAAHDRWSTVLDRLQLTQVREMAHVLCRSSVPVHVVTRQLEVSMESPELRAWFQAKWDRARDLLATYHDGRARPRKLERLLAVAFDMLSTALAENGGLAALRSHPGRVELESTPAAAPKDWEKTDAAHAQSLIRIARNLARVDHAFLGQLLALVAPVVHRVRDGLNRDGWVTFQGLLDRAKELLREAPEVREELKREFRAIVVDEFQDTDPAQYEIVLYLAEQLGVCAHDWRDVELCPGKLCIVGDPKQSIYAFRGADLEAFDRVVHKVERSGGLRCHLVTNFRSHTNVLDVVNESFAELFHPEEHVQPPNIVMTAGRAPSATDDWHGVSVRAVFVDDEDDRRSATAVRAEADRLAQWMKQELLSGGREVRDGGHARPLRPGDIGLLFRKLTQAHVYLDALRRYQVPFVAEGEKHFYRRQEVSDIVNILRVINNAHDLSAMVGVLRSPVGGLSDREMYHLRQEASVNYFDERAVREWSHAKQPHVARLYQCFRDLHWAAQTVDVGELFERIFSAFPVLELAAASSYGEQAVANMLKVRSIAQELEDRPHHSFGRLVDLLVDRVREAPAEAEWTLEEASLDAVRVLTIHKAKGLEFPVVVLPGFQQGARGTLSYPGVSRDWTTGVTGVEIGGILNVGAVLTGEKARRTEEAEQRRLLYVAMTRAREQLVISCSPSQRATSGSFLSMFEEVLQERVSALHNGVINIGSSTVSHTSISAKCGIVKETPPGTASPPYGARSVNSWVEQWRAKEHEWEQLKGCRAFLTPTAMEHRSSPMNMSAAVRRTSVPSALTGTLIHRALERWPFGDEWESCWGVVVQHVRDGIPTRWSRHAGEIERDVASVLQAFMGSEAYSRLRSATIVGREVPFAIPWDNNGGQERKVASVAQVMDGVVDVVYEWDGCVWIADYKTDRVSGAEVATRVDGYRPQMRIYQQAVSSCVNHAPVRSQLIFVRLGRMVEL